MANLVFFDCRCANCEWREVNQQGNLAILSPPITLPPATATASLDATGTKISVETETNGGITLYYSVKLQDGRQIFKNKRIGKFCSICRFNSSICLIHLDITNQRRSDNYFIPIFDPAFL